MLGLLGTEPLEMKLALPDVTREKGLKRLQAAGDISESPLQSGTGF